MEVVTLVIAIIGAITGVASLFWQVVTFKRSGPRVKVTARQTILGLGAGVAEPHISVTASNSGRSPVTVKGWGLRMPDDRTMVMPTNLPWSASLPCRLEPGAEASWYMLTAEVHRFCAEEGIKHQEMIAFVNLADGSTANAKERGIGLA